MNYIYEKYTGILHISEGMHKKQKYLIYNIKRVNPQLHRP